MFAASDPDLFVAQIAIGGLVLAGFWRIIVWVRNAPVRPDPWDAEFEQKMQDPDTLEFCHHCSTPQPPGAWFCEHCGSAVGPYNNLMPYVCVFSQGEVFRNGVTDKLAASPLTIVGYLLYSLGNYLVFAPIYWFFLFKNLKRLKRERLDHLQHEVE
jgi:hypothetical protein